MAIDYTAIEKAGGLGKGEDHWLRGRKRRAGDVAFEEREKTKVRKRDKRCRWPDCANCRQWHARLECAHMRAKGMGGDHGTRSAAKDMMLLDAVTHGEQEQHQRDVRPLTADGTNGPCDFYEQDERGRMVFVARESAPFIIEHWGHGYGPSDGAMATARRRRNGWIR